MSDLDALLDPRTIRQRARRVWDRAIDGGTAFRVDVDRLPACVELVLARAPLQSPRAGEGQQRDGRGGDEEPRGAG